jgi:hypothetical protein
METPSEKPTEKPVETQPPQPQQPDQPSTVPTPEDPREKTPMRDPPLRPDHDKTRIAGEHAGHDEETVRGHQPADDDSSDLEANGAAGAIRPNNPSPDSTVFDENQSAR